MTAVQIHEKSVLLSDEEWTRLLDAGSRLGLKDWHRGNVESILSTYSLIEENRQRVVVPLNKKNLKTEMTSAAAHASRLAARLSLPAVQAALFAHGQSARYLPGIIAGLKLEQIIEALAEISPRLTEAADRYVAPRQNAADNRREMIQDLDKLLGGAIRQSDRWREFLSALCKAAKRNVGPETIKDDLKELERVGWWRKRAKG